jgi:hypothetical protein
MRARKSLPACVFVCRALGVNLTAGLALAMELAIGATRSEERNDFKIRSTAKVGIPTAAAPGDET